MTCTGLACLSLMGLTVRGTMRLAREQPEPSPERAADEAGDSAAMPRKELEKA
jgi:hypothetical protein